jgi:hypothetical protein
MPDEFGRVTILAVGVWQYQHLRRLTGPEKDLHNVRDILLDDPDIAIFKDYQYRELSNPTSEQLRQAINQYVFERGAENDILIFYFAGHGAAIGGNDFAFCTVDTNRLTSESVILPMTAVSFSEILKTLWLKKVIPIFLIDACYSGAAGGSLIAVVDQLMDELKGEIQRHYASSYALLCSAPNNQEVLDNPNGDGGLFSASLVELAQTGINSRDKRSPTITLTKLFPCLRERIEQNTVGYTPILLLGPTLPEFSIFKNTYYRPLEYRLQPHLVAVLQALWNDGNLRELRPGQIADVTQLKGAYGNHRKLSFEPWNLVETVSNRRRLNGRGIAFMQGRLMVPRDVILDVQSQVYIEKPGSDLVGIMDF